MQLITLGDLQLEGSDFKRPKALLLLAFLALEGKQKRAFLAELFWLGESNALRNLSLTLSRLNKVAPECLVMDNGFVEAQLPCDALTLISAFDLAEYGQVEVLYQGAFLQSVVLKNWCYELEEWVYSTRESLAAKLRSACLALASQCAAEGDFAHAARLADQAYQVKHAPEAEISELKQLFTLLRAADHRSATAVQKEAAFYDLKLDMSMREAREALTPSSIKLEQVHSKYLTPFIGRDAEVNDITSQLLKPEVRLFCLTGIGGAGKTRLASVVISQAKVHQHYSDGCYFVPLEALEDASLIPLEIATALDLQLTDEDLWRNLSILLAERHVLLVLDNLEQVIEEAAVPLESFIKHCPFVTVLATSREVLNVPGEVIYELKGLRVPPHTELDFSEYGATKLFITSAKRVKRSFNTEANKAHILSICKQLEGWPLGIALAAAWVRQRACADIARALDSNLDVLNSRSRTVLSRHKSARAAFMHSWELLSEVEQASLARLSVFKGGFSLEAAVEVTHVTLPVLASLLDKSLLNLDEKGRYRAHPLVLQYSFEKLSELPDLQEVEKAHGEYYLALTRANMQHLRTLERKSTLEKLEPDFENIKAAWAWAVKAEALRLLIDSSPALHELFTNRREEAYRQFNMVTHALNTRNPVHHRALGHTLIYKAEALAGAKPENAKTKKYLMHQAATLLKGVDDKAGLNRILRFFVDWDDTQDLQSGLEHARAHGTTVDVANWLWNITLAARESKDIETGRQIQEEAVAECHTLGDTVGVMLTLLGYGTYLVYNEFYQQGVARLLEACDLSERLDHKEVHIVLLTELAHAALLMDDYADAEHYAEDALVKLSRAKLDHMKAKNLLYLGRVALQKQQYKHARFYYQKSFAIALIACYTMEQFVHYSYYLKAQVSTVQATELLAFVASTKGIEKRDTNHAKRLLAELRTQLSSSDFEAAKSRGEALGFETILAEALAVLDQPLD